MTSQEATAAPAAGQYELSHLRSLEAEAIHIIREVAAEFERPVLLFSGGKDSIVMLALAEKAFRPANIPFPVMHVDTGHNFPEVLDYRDRRGDVPRFRHAGQLPLSVRRDRLFGLLAAATWILFAP